MSAEEVLVTLTVDFESSVCLFESFFKAEFQVISSLVIQYANNESNFFRKNYNYIYFIKMCFFELMTSSSDLKSLLSEV